MKLTKAEKMICEAFSERDENGFVKCRECPLRVDIISLTCYATIDGRTTKARGLHRYNTNDLLQLFREIYGERRANEVD